MKAGIDGKGGLRARASSDEGSLLKAGNCKEGVQAGWVIPSDDRTDYRGI